MEGLENYKEMMTLLAEEKDTEKIAEHLGTLVRNHELRLTLGQNAREMVQKEFDLTALNDELADYFSSGIKSIKAG